MKIRNGFVSNSSSSSFIINGVKITNIEGDKIHEKFTWKELYDMKLSLQENKYYFDLDEKDGYIIGETNQELEDGEILELSPLTEEKKQLIVNKLKEYLNIQVNINDIKTYIQYVSNDNF
jgi:hypothetical protein